MIFGVKNTGNGFSSNSEELKTATILLDNLVIRPFQNMLVTAFNQVLLANGFMVDIYFKTLQPLEFIDLSGKSLDASTKEKELGLSLSKVDTISVEMTDDDEHEWLIHLQDKGEVVDMDVWDLIDVREATEEDELLEFAYDNPDLKSKDDKGIFKIRYKYGPDNVSSNSRKFCKEMVSLTNQGIVYRREDINQMSFSGVNGQFAPEGRSTYSIWRFKGGVNCHHAWYRVTYMRKTIKGMIKPLTTAEKGTDIRDMDNYNPVSNEKANAEGVPFSPPNWKDAKTKPIDMPNKGSWKSVV